MLNSMSRVGLPGLPCRVAMGDVGVQVENLNTAFELYKEMEGTSLEADCVTYATLMDLCAEARQGQRAVTLMQVCCCDL